MQIKFNEMNSEYKIIFDKFEKIGITWKKLESFLLHMPTHLQGQQAFTTCHSVSLTFFVGDSPLNVFH
jgi:hypothetical protein